MWPMAGSPMVRVRARCSISCLLPCPPICPQTPQHCTNGTHWHQCVNDAAHTSHRCGMSQGGRPDITRNDLPKPHPSALQPDPSTRWQVRGLRGGGKEEPGEVTLSFSPKTPPESPPPLSILNPPWWGGRGNIQRGEARLVILDRYGETTYYFLLYNCKPMNM